MDDGGWRRGGGGGMGGGWGRGYGRVKGDDGGGCSRIKNEIVIMECVEHNTPIDHNVMNEYVIEAFKKV